jgi:archaellum component FlaC
MREVCNAEWDDIQDRLKEKDAEIEGLKRDNAFMASNDYVESLTSEIERLKSLLARAAEALAPFDEIYPQQKRSDLIVELRRAAE